MKKNFLIAILSLSFFNSCQLSENKKSGEEFPISYEMKHVFVKDEACKDKLEECTRLDVEYFEFAEPKGYIANLQTSQMIQFIAGIEISDTIVTAESSANELIKLYGDFKKNFPDSKQYWSVSMQSEITYSSNELLCITMITGSYLGGAHGDFRHSFLTINKSGDRVNVIDFITDMNKFSEIAEIKYREQRGLTKSQSLNTGGYFFPEQKFILPEGIGLNEKGFVLYYNVYEIAPFYLGGTEIIISFDDLDGILKKPFFQ